MIKFKTLQKSFFIATLFLVPSLAYSEDHEEEHHEEELSDEERGELEQEAYELFEEITQLYKGHGPEEYLKLLEEVKEHHLQHEPEEVVERLEELIKIVEHDGEEAMVRHIQFIGTEFQLHQLVERYHDEDNTKEKAKLKEEIRKKLAKVLEARLVEREQELKHMEEEIEHIKKGIQAARSNPEHYISKRLNELTEDEFDPFD